MLAKVYGCAVVGLDGVLVEVGQGAAGHDGGFGNGMIGRLSRKGARLSIKAELYELVDGLDEQGALDALAYLRRVADGDGAQRRQPVEATSATEAFAARAGRSESSVVPGREFMRRRPRTLRELAAEQGVRPVTTSEDLLGDFWPEDETVDEFVTAVREWRRDGGGG